MELTGNESQTGKNLVAGETSPLVSGENLPPIVRGFVLLPRVRQIGVIASLALAMALVVALLLWSQKTEYSRLFSSMPEKEAGEVVEVLRKLNVEFQLDGPTGAIMVPEDKVHELRLKLASQGFPREGGAGFEMLEKETSFGSSQFMETARFQRALEGEIARSIATIRNVRSARVHLALPKESVFVRQPKKPSASVVVDLNSGYGLEPGQVEAIVHLVASSVQQLEPDLVTVVDQRGHLLNSKEAASGINLTSKQFDYKKQVEDHLIDRVDNILSPVVGPDGLRTQVTADVDFSVTERTQEVYNPDLPALRSEQTSEEQSRQGAAV
ncbi:MAG: flagellar M-ring protein, partial [Proteobacteria bacterium]|nr:flagellar M-ring protein [Pseudomonadota bacterium]